MFSKLRHVTFPPLALLALTVAALQTASAQSYLFDFGGANTTIKGDPPADPLNTWNNITTVGTAVPGTPAAQLDHVVSTGNLPSNVSLVMLARFNGVNEAGTQASTVYPLNATRDTLFGNTENFNGSNFFPSFKFTGLDPQVNHTLTFYASRSGVNDNRETLYTITGANTSSTSLNAANNIDGTAGVSDIKPSAAGEITVALTPGANNNNGNHFTYLGVLRLDVNLDQVPVVFTTEPADTTVLAGRPVTFTAAVQSSPPYTIQWQKDGSAIEGANQFTYTIPAATPDLNGSKYSVTVSNLQFTKTSRTATLSVTTDSVPPTLTSSSSAGPQDIRLVFSEDLEEIASQDPGSYVINDGAVTVISAVLQPDRRTVILSTQEEMAGSATVKISQVQDVNGNAIAANTPATVTVPVPDGLSWLIDFGTGGTTTERGTSPDDTLNIWNNVTEGIAQTDGGLLDALVKNDGTITAVGLQIISRFNAANTNGVLTSTLYPGDATRDTLYGNTEAFNTLANITPVFRLTGLDTTKAYDFKIYASRDGVTDNRETRYTVTGLNSAQADLNVANNVDNTVSVTGIYPDGEGGVTIALTPTANNNNANHFVYIGVLRMSLNTSPPPVVLTSEPQDIIVHAGDPVTFTVGVQSPQPYSIQWKKNGENIAGATQLTYTIPAATVDLDGAKYSATVTYLGSTVTSRAATLKVTTDSVPPTVLSANASVSSFSLVFSEELDKASAETLTNYTINDGAVAITSAVLQADKRTVVLTTPDALAGTVNVKISQVRDVNTNVIAANTKASAIVPIADGLSTLIDFGGTATSDPVLTWNTVTQGIGQTDGGVLEGLVKNDGTVTAVGLQIVSRFNAENGDGATTSTLFPADATRDSLYGNTEAWGGLTNVTPIIRLTGLEAASAYSFTFYASRSGVTDNRETRYTVTGSSSAFADLNVASNINNTATVDGIQPDAQGGITIALTPSPNNVNANHFTYLGVLQITSRAVIGGDAVAILPPVIQNGNLIISWTGTGVLESSTELSSGWAAVNPQPTSPYSIPLPLNGRKFFRVRP
ncbi:MAG: immunoglobulin domain-containing protein [Verrucomicrobiota bacterium]